MLAGKTLSVPILTSVERSRAKAAGLEAEVASQLGVYSRKRIFRTSIIQGFAQLGSDLLVDFDLMMTIPILGPFFLGATQLSMPWILRFLYTPEF